MNAKEEFLGEIRGKELICARIEYGYEYKKVCLLHPNHDAKQLNTFLEKLNFEYDAGYGGQELFGTILFKDSYSTRGEYDGSEWWVNHAMPTPAEVIGIP